jgi:hypothetical protein
VNNTKKESQQHNRMKALIGISVVLTSFFTAFIVSRSDCTGNWLDRNLRLSDEGCFKGSVSDLNYSDKKLTFTDQHGKSQAIDFSKFVDEVTTISSKGATPTVAFSLDGTKLIMFIGNKTTGETSSSVVDLSSLIGSGTDKDNQNLSLAGTILSIRNGNSIDLAAIASAGPRGPVGAAGLTGPQGLVGAPGPQGSPGVLTVSNGMLTLAGTDLSISSCAAAEILEYNGSAWACANDNDTTYGAGNGLTLNSGTLELGGTLSRDTVIVQNGYSVEFDNILASGRTTELHLGDDVIGAGIEGVGFTSSDAANTGIMGYLFAGDATSSGGSANMAGVGLNDFANNEFAQYNAFDTGSGLGSRVASSSPLFSSDATWLNDQIQLSTSNSGGNSSVMLNPSALYVNANLQFSGELRPGGNAGMANQVLVSAGPGSTPYWADPGTLLLAGAGVSIIGNTVAISSPVCSGADKLQWDGSVFLCSVDTDTTYTAGTGISFAGTTISATLGTDITSSEIVDGTITGTDIATGTVSTTNITDGTITATDLAATGATAGTYGDSGVNVPQLTVNAAGQVTAVSNRALPTATGATTGVLSSADWTTFNGKENVLTFTGNGLFSRTGNTITGLACTAGQIPKWTGSAFACGTDVDTNTTYSAGNGLSLAGTTFSVNAPTCAGTTKLQWNGTAFLCAADVDTDTTNFTVSANGGATQTINAGNNVNFVNGTGTTATRTGSDISYGLTNVGTAGTYGSATTVPVITTDAQGRVTGVTNTAITFPAEVDGVIGNEVTNATANGGLVRSGSGTTGSPYTLGLLTSCTNGQVLKWTTGTTSWGCANDTDTTYTAGTGISFAGTTISATLGTDITSSEIVDGTITTVDLANDAVTSAKVLDGTVISADISDGTLLFADVAVNGCTANQIFKFNGVSWACGADTAGISSLNGLTTGTQTFAVGTSGTDFNIVSSGSAHTFNIPDASLTARGLVTTTAQTLNGVKTFDSGVVVSSTACASAASSNNVFCQGGNSYGVAAVIGTNDFQSLQLETAGTTAATISSGGEFLARDPTDSTVSFQIQNSANLPVLTIDTVNNRINVGSSTADANALTLVLDSYNNAIDPLGVDGSLYYNAALGKFRCYESGTWKDCIGGPMILRVASDVSNTSNVTYADVTGLTASVVAGRTYSFSCNLTYNTAVTTTAIHLSVNGPATSALDYAVLVQTTATAQHNAVQTAFNTVTNPATGGGVTRLPAEISGTFTPTAAGTFAVRLKSEVNASSVTVKRGSFCELY